MVVGAVASWGPTAPPRSPGGGRLGLAASACCCEEGVLAPKRALFCINENKTREKLPLP